MEKETRKILGRTFGVGEYKDARQWYTNTYDQTGSMAIAKRIIAKYKSAKGLKFKKYMKIMQEAYFKRFLKVFQLRPEDLDTITLGSGF